MKLLLDTQCWLWIGMAPRRLSSVARAELANVENETFLSAASSWEIAIKYALGRLELPEPPKTYVPSRLVRSGATAMRIEHAHVLQVAELPRHHKDPFDRLLIAQAQVEGLTIVTSDAVFERYDVRVLSAV